MANRKRTLFLCTGNSCRSQMAEGLLRHYGGDDFEVFSAGLDPHPIHPLAIEVMAEKGIDISAQQSTDLKEYLGRQTLDYAIIVCDKAHGSCPRIWPGLSELVFWPFEDPAAFQGDEESTKAKFREVRDEIETRLKEWIPSVTG